MDLKEEEHMYAMNTSEEERDITIKAIKDQAVKERLEIVQEKTMQFQNLLKVEKEKVQCRMKDEMNENDRIRDEQEEDKLGQLRDQIDRIRTENDNDKQSLYDEITRLKQSTNSEIKKRTEEIQKQADTTIKSKIDKVSMQQYQSQSKSKSKSQFQFQYTRIIQHLLLYQYHHK